MEEALTIHPNKKSYFINGKWDNDIDLISWDYPNNLFITCLGQANGFLEIGVLISN